MRCRQRFGLVKRKISGKTVYYYWYRNEDDVRQYRSTGEKTKAKALDYVLELDAQGKLGQLDSSMVKLRDFSEDFFIPEKCPIVRNARTRGKSMTNATCDVRRTALVKHVWPHLGDISVSTLTPKRINRWLMALPETDGVSRTTANSYLIVLKLVMDEAVRQGIVKQNPCTDVENLGSDSVRRAAFTAEEVRKIIGKPEDWDNVLVRLMCLTASLTGMRIGEVRALKPECITDTALHIKASFSNDDGYKLPKNGKERVAPIPPQLRDQLRLFSPKDGGYIFRLWNDKPISTRYVRDVLAKRMKDVGVEGKTFHSFRAFFNTELMSDNVNETVVRSVIGHQSADMTEHYLHLEVGEFAQVRATQNRLLEGMILA